MLIPDLMARNVTGLPVASGLISTSRRATGTQAARQSLTRTTSQWPSGPRSMICPSRRNPLFMNSASTFYLAYCVSDSSADHLVAQAVFLSKVSVGEPGQVVVPNH